MRNAKAVAQLRIATRQARWSHNKYQRCFDALLLLLAQGPSVLSTSFK
jgi:hypothetical protein